MNENCKECEGLDENCKWTPEEKCERCIACGFDEKIGHYCQATLCTEEYDYDPDTRTWTPKPKPDAKKGGCFQLVYCSECLAFDVCKKEERVDWMKEAIEKLEGKEV